MSVPMLDIYDISSRLSVPKRKVVAMAREGSIPCYLLPCGDYVFNSDEIDDWLNGNRQGNVPSPPARPPFKASMLGYAHMT